MKSIKSKLMVFFGLIMGGMCVGLTIISVLNSSIALQSNLEKTLSKIAEQAAGHVGSEVESGLNSLESIAAREDIKDANNSVENKRLILLGEAKRKGSIRMGIIEGWKSCEFRWDNHKC